MEEDSCSDTSSTSDFDSLVQHAVAGKRKFGKVRKKNARDKRRKRLAVLKVLDDSCSVVDRVRNMKRDRTFRLATLLSLEDHEFTRMYRLTKVSFAVLLKQVCARI